MLSPTETAFLGDVESRLAQVLEQPKRHDGRGILLQAAKHLTLAPSKKRVRPRLVAAFGRAVGVQENTLVDIATAAELMHVASLLHDDVIDQANERRGKATVNTVWSNTVAVLSGDLLLTAALRQLVRYPRPVSDSGIATVGEMAEAMMLETARQGDPNTTEADWRQIAEGKTGALFGWCGFATAICADNEAAGKQFDRVGRHLGVAFQLADDLKDLVSREEGKPPLADLRERRPNYVVIRAMQKDPALHKALTALWTSDANAEPGLEASGALAERVLATGAADSSRSDIDRELAAAVENLGSYKTRFGSDNLLGWAEELLAGLKHQSP